MTELHAISTNSRINVVLRSINEITYPSDFSVGAWFVNLFTVVDVGTDAPVGA